MTGFTDVLTQDILVTSILMGLIALVGLVGNALMLRALIVYPQLRTEFYVVFGSLSIVDSVFLAISVPAQIMDMVQAIDSVTDAWCKGSHYIINMCGFTAAYLLVVLTILRGILLTNRNNVRRPKATHLLIVCIVISFIVLMCTIPIIFVFNSYNGICDYVDIVQEQNRYTWLISTFSTFVPLAVIVLIYFMTYMLGKRYFPDSYSPREKEKSWLVTYIIIAFTICQIPYRFMAIYELGIDKDDHAQLLKMYTVKNYLMCLVMADKAVRPILYTKVASDLSDAFDEVINCTFCAKHYSMGSRFGRTSTVYTTPSNTATTRTRPIDSNPMSTEGNRVVSTFSETSTTSHTPLTRIEDDIEMNIEIET